MSLFCGTLSAQTVDTSSVWNLSVPQSVVSAYEHPLSMNASDHLSGREITRFPVVSDAIRHLSGVQIKDYGGIGGLKTVNVRSLGSEHTGVFIDGLQVDNAQNMQVDLGRFSTDNIGYIDLFSGARGSNLQTAKEYASSSSIYLTTLAPVFSLSRTNAWARVRAGSFMTFNPSLSVEHLLKTGASVRFSAEGNSSRGDFRFHRSSHVVLSDGTYSGYDTVMVRRNSDIAAIRAEVQVFSPSGTRSVWDVRSYLYASDRGLPGPVVRRLSQTTADRQTDLNLFLQGRWKRNVTEDGRSSVLLSSKISHDRLHYWTRPDIDPHAMPFDNTYLLSSAYGSMSWRYRVTDRMSAGLAQDLQYSYLDADMPGFVYPGRYAGWTAVSVSWYPGSVRLDASAVWNVALDRYGNASAAHSGAFAKKNDNRSALTPSVAFTWKMSPSSDVAAFVKRSYRMPSFNDLYYTLVGNSNLDPESAWQSDVSYQYTGEFGQWSLLVRPELYYNHVTDKIIATPTSSQFRWSMYNIGNVHILGSEIKARVSRSFASSGSLSLLGRYSLQDARDFSSSQSATYDRQIPYVSRHSGSITAEAVYGVFCASTVYTLTGKRWSVGSESDDYLIRPWKSLDVSLSADIKRENGRGISVQISLNNLFNEQYELVQGYPMPGFNMMAGIRADF